MSIAVRNVSGRRWWSKLDEIPPMTVLRRLDAALEDSKQAVLHMKATVDTTGAGKRDFVPRPMST